MKEGDTACYPHILWGVPGAWPGFVCFGELTSQALHGVPCFGSLFSHKLL